MVEQTAVNREVGGSNPPRRAKLKFIVNYLHISNICFIFAPIMKNTTSYSSCWYSFSYEQGRYVQKLGSNTVIG